MYELGFYISEDGILHSHRRCQSLKSYTFIFSSNFKMHRHDKLYVARISQELFSEIFLNPISDLLVDTCLLQYWEFLVASFHIQSLGFSARHKYDCRQTDCSEGSVLVRRTDTYVQVCYSRRIRWNVVAI
jgi:hypothetical protein